MTSNQTEIDPSITGQTGHGKGEGHEGHNHGNEQASATLAEQAGNAAGAAAIVGAASGSAGGISGLVKESMSSIAAELGISEQNMKKIMDMLGMGNAVQMIEMFGSVLSKLNDKDGAHADHDKREMPENELGNLTPPAALGGPAAQVSQGTGAPGQ